MNEQRSGEEEGAVVPRPDPFEAAVTRYHECVREAVSNYQKRWQELRSQYSEAVESAYKEPTPALVQQRLNAANEQASQGQLENAKTADGEVAQCLQHYVVGMTRSFAEATVGEMTVAKLAYVGQEMWFIANAASGAFPIEWWSSRS